jgi:hypothetical protein
VGEFIEIKKSIKWESGAPSIGEEVQERLPLYPDFFSVYSYLLYLIKD